MDEQAEAVSKKNRAPVLAESGADPLMSFDEKPDRYAAAICIGVRLDCFCADILRRRLPATGPCFEKTQRTSDVTRMP
jgi:hypothetical protein